MTITDSMHHIQLQGPSFRISHLLLLSRYPSSTQQIGSLAPEDDILIEP